MYQLVYEISNSICVNNEFGDSVFRTAIRGCDKNYSPDPLCYYLHLKSRILYTVHYFATQATVLQQLFMGPRHTLHAALLLALLQTRQRPLRSHAIHACRQMYMCVCVYFGALFTQFTAI